MLSRIADSLYWLARYIERAEDTARILDVNYHMMLEQSPQSCRLQWDPLVSMAGESQRFKQFYNKATSRTVFEFLAFRPDNPSSILQCVTKARENARTIRDRISREMWEDINGLFHAMTKFEPEIEMAAGPHRFCEAVKFGSHRFHGVAEATLPHDEGWQFLKIGWLLERAEMTARLVDVQYQHLLDASPVQGEGDSHLWMAVLKSVGAYETYRRLYHSTIDPQEVAEMLILNSQHPRSIRFSMTGVQSGLREISGSVAGSYANEAERLTGKVLESLRYDKIEDIFSRGLHSHMTDLLKMCRAIDEGIARTYFYYAVVA